MIVGVQRPEWHRDAACRDEDPDLFFPRGIQGDVHRRRERAKAVCRTCPVWEECLRDAMDGGRPMFGMRGGLTVNERYRIQQGKALWPDEPGVLTEASAPAR